MTPDQRKIIERVAERNGMSVRNMLCGSRIHAIAHVRQEAAWALRQEGRWSYPRIAAVLGWTHHTSALHGVRAHEARLAQKMARAA